MQYTGDRNAEFLKAVRNGNASDVQWLIQEGTHVETRDSGGSSALGIAVDYGHFDIAQLLLRHGSSPVQAGLIGDDALIEAARSGIVHRVEFLLQQGVKDTAKIDALFAAAGEGLPAIVVSPPPEKALNPESGPDTLIVADSAKTVDLLLQAGVDKNVRDMEGATPLIRAAEHGNTDVVRLLLNQRADVDARDKSGETALIAAACECAIIDMPSTTDSMKLLLQKKANVNARDNLGRTALMVAAAAGRTENVRLLLDAGAMVNAKDNKGNTALMLATKKQDADIVSILKANSQH